MFLHCSFLIYSKKYYVQKCNSIKFHIWKNQEKSIFMIIVLDAQNIRNINAFDCNAMLKIFSIIHLIQIYIYICIYKWNYHLIVFFKCFHILSHY